jgi:hypothetical protein
MGFVDVADSIDAFRRRQQQRLVLGKANLAGKFDRAGSAPAQDPVNRRAQAGNSVKGAAPTST